MGIFNEGWCKNDYCSKGREIDWRYNSKTDQIEETGTKECDDCLGTELNLTSMGKELVEFLREAKIKL